MADDKMRTIDNLPIETSIRYEENKVDFDKNLLKESGEVKHIVGLDTFDSTLHSNVSKLFDLNMQNPPWGNIAPPPSYNMQTGRLFTHQLAPSLGPQDRIDAAEARIEGLKKETLETITENPRSVEGKRKITDVENESHALQSMLLTITEINKEIEYVNGERSRFKKG